MKLKTVKTAGYGILGLFCVLVLAMLATGQRIFGILSIAAIVVYTGFLLVFWRCPGCGGFLGRFDTKYCPRCGERLPL